MGEKGRGITICHGGIGCDIASVAFHTFLWEYFGLLLCFVISFYCFGGGDDGASDWARAWRELSWFPSFHRLCACHALSCMKHVEAHVHHITHDYGPGIGRLPIPLAPFTSPVTLCRGMSSYCG